MELYEREFFISRICAGYLKYKLNNDIAVYIRPLTKGQYYEAQEIFMESLEEALNNGVMTPEESMEMLFENGLWDEEREEQLIAIEKSVEDYKVGIYESFFRTKEKEKYRALLKEANILWSQYYRDKHSYDYVNTTGVATYARWNWIIENTTSYEDGSSYDWKHIDVQNLLAKYQESFLEEWRVRELARTEPWRVIWRTGKDNLFDQKGVELTLNQKNLFVWSMTYDSVSESHEPPPQEVIQDNDALDGWFLKEARKREGETFKQNAESNLGITADADEVFMMAPDKEDRKKINRLNDPMVRQQQYDRMKKIKGEKGDNVSYYEFNDVRQRINEQIADSVSKGGK